MRSREPLPRSGGICANHPEPAMTFRTAVSLAALAAGLAGCTVGPDYRPPDVKVSESFVAAPAPPADAANGSKEVPGPGLAHWWTGLGDAELDRLVDRAVASNYDVEIALTRLQEARTEQAVVLGQALPVAEVSAAAAKGTGTNSTRGRISGALNAATNTTGLHEVTQVYGADAYFDLDFFGRYRRLIEAAKADTQAAVEARSIVIVGLVSDVASAYVELRGLQSRLDVARRNVTRAQETDRVVQTRFDRGLTNELDVTLAQRQLALQQAQVRPLEAAVAVAIDRIAMLLGEAPESLGAELSKPGAIPEPPLQFDLGKPIEQLRRRPDIRQAERDLAAATARIGVATAQLFPDVALTGAVGAQGQGLGVNPAVNKFIWSAGPQLYLPLLDFGTLDSLIDIADLRAHEQLVAYKQTILQAVEDVDDGIANYAAAKARIGDLRDALAASERAVTLASGRYERGLTDFLNVLDAERQEYDLEDQYAASRQDLAAQYVLLCRGLGGGWEDYQAIPAVRSPDPALIAAFHRLLSPEGAPK
jgi:NodT family efflux transporter outer membrane factor (OMF) lipoprotein